VLPSRSPVSARPTAVRHSRGGAAAVVCALVLFGTVRPVLAQSSGTWLNLGIGVTQFEAAAADHTNNVGWGLAWRFGTSSTGWGPSVGFNWFDTGLKTRVAGQPTALGSLHVRPVMVGYGYTRRRGHVSIEVSGMVGYAFNHLSVGGQFRQAYLEKLGTWVSGHAHNSFVAKPQVSIWYDIAPRVGLNFSAGYLLTRPDITLTTGAGAQTMRWNADMAVLSVGIVYGIF